MSMHEFEDLVEHSVHALASTGRDPQELRSIYWNLYEFEARYDTGFTHFRNMEELLAARFVYRIPMTEHPDYAEHRVYFDGLHDFEFIDLPGADDDSPGIEFPADGPSPVEMLLAGADARAIRDCVETLEAGARQAIALAFFHGLSHGELAAHLREPLGTVKSWVRRGLAKLRRCLDQTVAAR